MAINILVVILVIFLIENLSTFIGRGNYNSTFNFYVCHSDTVCLHEIGHASDDSLNWISQSKEYDTALTVYLVINWNLQPEQRDSLAERAAFFPGFLSSKEIYYDPFSLPFWTGGWGGKMELYASMLEWADGLYENIPERLRGFYNWKLINKATDYHG